MQFVFIFCILSTADYRPGNTASFASRCRGIVPNAIRRGQFRDISEGPSGPILAVAWALRDRPGRTMRRPRAGVEPVAIVAASILFLVQPRLCFRQCIATAHQAQAVSSARRIGTGQTMCEIGELPSLQNPHGSIGPLWARWTGRNSL